MSLIIFFGLASFITVLGFGYSFFVIRHHWQKTETYKKWNKKNDLSGTTAQTAVVPEIEKKSLELNPLQNSSLNQLVSDSDQKLITNSVEQNTDFSFAYIMDSEKKDLSVKHPHLNHTELSSQENIHPSLVDSVKAKELLLLLLLFSSLFFSVKTQAWVQTELRPSLRTYPTGFSVTATAKDEFLIWDQRDQQFWQFGLVKPQISVATHGQLEAGVSLYPISFVELFSSVAWTNRYYDTKPFDCDLYQCQGTVQRQKLGARMALQFDSAVGAILLVPTYQQTHLEGENKKTIVDEEEVLLAHSDWDVLTSQSLFAGLKWEHQTTGLYYKQSQFQRSASRNQSEYLIHQFKYLNPKLERPFDVVIGVGRYYSDYSDASFSAIAALSWRWGDSLALF